MFQFKLLIIVKIKILYFFLILFAPGFRQSLPFPPCVAHQFDYARHTGFLGIVVSVLMYYKRFLYGARSLIQKILANLIATIFRSSLQRSLR